MVVPNNKSYNNHDNNIEEKEETKKSNLLSP